MQNRQLRTFQVIGPPGCGKSTYLAVQINAAARKYGLDKVLVTSFTNAAAQELASRELPIKKDMVSTLHSHAYRSIGVTSNKIADTMIDEWNSAYPTLSLSGGSAPEDSIDSNSMRGGIADKAYSALQIFRARMIPREMWRSLEGGWEAIKFEEKWNDFKKANNAIDFTDMLEIALRDTVSHPDHPSIIFVDEYQDMTKLEIALVNHWGEQTQGIMVAGDPDQNLYSFKGASPKQMLDNMKALPAEHQHTLNQSYRVPHAPQKYAMKWIAQAKEKSGAEYKPRDEEGFVKHAGFGLNDAQSVVRDMHQYLGLKVYDERWGRERPATIMIQASCGYMIDAVKYELRNQGIPFHNPYRKTRGDWNPIHSSRGVSTSERIMAFTRPDNEVHGKNARMWNGEDISKVINVLSAEGNLVRGAKSKIEKIAKSTKELSVEDLLGIFTESALERLMSGDINWFYDNITPSRKQTAEFAFKIANKHGIAKLTETPQIMLGTTHSFKGTQADIVYMSPDLSSLGNQKWCGNNADRDEIYRLMYVGMTRCRQGLILLSPSSGYAVDLP